MARKPGERALRLQRAMQQRDNTVLLRENERFVPCGWRQGKDSACGRGSTIVSKHTQQRAGTGTKMLMPKGRIRV